MIHGMVRMIFEIRKYLREKGGYLMKKGFLSISILMAGVLLASCGQSDNNQGARITADTIASGCPDSGEHGTGGNTAGELPVDEKVQKEYAEEDKGADVWVEEEALLSDKILKINDTLQVMSLTAEETLYPVREITLRGIQLFDSPEEAGLDREKMQQETENYDTVGDPEWCSFDEGKLLVCNLNIKNLDKESDGDLHMSEFMIAYADPDTGKVTIVSCDPVYLSASSSQAGSSDYLHYQISTGENKDMTVAWLVQEEYDVENLYLCVTYDMRDPSERQYFRMSGQE